MRLLLLILSAVGLTSARAEVVSRETGLSISDSGVQLKTPTGGQGIDVQADSSGFQVNFSLTGSRPGQGNDGSGPLPIQRLAPVPPSSALTNSDEFFRGVGKRDDAPKSRRPLAR